MATTSRDPRTIVTPDAFSVHPPLLGTPLAGPSRRGVALLIDVVLVASITALTSGFWFIFGAVAAAFFLTRAKKQKRKEGTSNVLRFFLGCMGFMALSVTALVLVGIWIGSQSDDFGPAFSLEDQAGDPLQRGIGPSVDDLQTLIGGLQEAAVADTADERLAQAIDVARDTIAELEQGLALANLDLENTRAELDEARQEGGLIEWFTSRIDSLGFGLGWWTLYFAILMPWMKGQTPGKRTMGVRVVRLDGRPVTWWHAFERAGGYAAGVATGTLGFLQIYWDPNRQAIHDKVAGTVVIREGAPKVPGNWERLVTDSTTQPSGARPA